MVPLLELSNWVARTLAIPGIKASWSYGRKRWWRRRFKRVFGSTSREYTVAYASLEVNPMVQEAARQINAQVGEFPLVKPTRPTMMFKAQKVVSGSEFRALSHIGPALLRDGGIAGKPVADDSISDKLDLDFISFGAMSNLKTLDVLSNAANNLAEYSDQAGVFISKKDRRALCAFRSSYDYGLILKIHPHQFPQRTWIACAGLGEWGTSGSTWFLANRWTKIAERVEEREQFVCVIQVTPGQDESAQLHHFRK